MNHAGLDTSLFFLINKTLAYPFLDRFMVFITNKNRWIFLALGLFIAFREKKKERGLYIALAALASVGLADWISSSLKDVIGRIRPCNALEGVRLLVGCSGSYSMPSGHATNSFAVAMPFLLLTKNRLKWLMLFLAALVAYSRPYVGVHYPGDVLAGALLGSLIAISIVGFFRLADKKGGTEGPLMIFLAAMTLFRFYYIMRGGLDLSGDEAHYWEWTRRLDIGYYSKGPIIAYLIKAGTLLFGNTEFGVRFFAPVLLLLGSILLYRLGTALYDKETGFWAAILYQIIPLFSAFGVLMTIDAPFLFFWVLALLLFFRAVTLKSLPEWLLLGIVVGLGLLTKFTMAFFFVSALFYLLVSREDRAELLSPRPYLALILSLLVLAPLLLWDMQHGWINLKHNLSHADLQDGLRFSAASLLQFIGSQAGVVTPLLFFMLIYASARQRKSDPFAFWFFAPTFVFFLLKSVQGKVQANWAMAGYVSGLFAFHNYFLRDLKYSGAGRKALAGAAIVLSIAVTVVSFYPNLIGLPTRLDPTARLHGWKSLARELDRSEIPELQKGGKPFFIFSDGYQLSSELAFYLKGQPVTYCANIDRRMNQYDLWPGFEGLIRENALFVTIGDSDLPEKLKAAFGGYEKKSFTATEKGKVLRQYSIFICRDFKGLKKEEFTSF